MPSQERLKQEAERILKLIRSTSFEACLPFEPKHKNLSFAAGIYAIKSRHAILYVGLASAFRTRFQSSGHKALERMFLAGVNVKEVRILLIPIAARYLDQMLLIEKHLLFCLEPKYNERMPRVDELSMPQLKTPTTGHLKEVLRHLPDYVVDALEDHADTYGLTDAQVLELAIVHLLDLDTTSLGDLGKLKPMSQLAEENAILKARLRALGQAVED